MEINEIKQRLSIQTVLQHYKLHTDKNNMLQCPFHADDTASMKVYPNTNTFNCFGCGKNGDVIEFIQLKENCNKHTALVKAAELAGSSAVTNVKAGGEIKPINGKIVQPKKPKENHIEILTRIFAYFQNGLNSSIAKKPKEYLQSRNLNHELLEVGYNSGQFHHRGKLNEKDMQACIAAGLLIPYNGKTPNSNGTTYTAFAKECLMFPLKDKSGNIVSLYGRSIIDNKKSKHFYTANRTGLYPGYPSQNVNRLILCEAIIDAATLLQIPEITEAHSVLACYGTNGLTAEHTEAIKGLQKLEEIIFFFDGDHAGRGAIKKYQTELNELLPNVKLSAVETPEGEDISSLSVAYDKDALLQLIEERKPFLLTEVVEEKQRTHTEVPPEPPRTQAKLNIKNPEFITFTTNELQIIILGGINLQQLDRLRITVKISRTDTNDPLHSIRHTIDLYHSDYLEKFINKASEQLEAGTNSIRRAIAEMTEQIEAYRLSKIESQKEQKPQARQLSEQRYRKAVNYLQSSKLMERTNNDIGRTGMIGEENNRLLMYLVFTSRLREHPLHIISLGASGTGKTYLQEKISELIPEQEKLEITILSENAFYYFDRKELKHKLVLIEDMDGAMDVLYPLRELQSKKRISKRVPIKDSKGNMKTVSLVVEGPICLAGTTTKERLYEDNANRSLLIYLDGSNEHKEMIMDYQRQLSAGKVRTKEENQMKEFFKDMQTVLKPLKVRNPYAELLKLPEYIFKPLRTNAHYLATIETITFYHQYQREIRTDANTGERYIETTLEDIKWANILLKDVLLAKADELPRAVREFFESLKRWVKKEQKENFYTKEVRERLRMYPMKVNRYMHELESRGFIRKTGGNKKTGFEYEIYRWDDYEKLKAGTDVLNDILEEIRSKTNSVNAEQSQSVTLV